MINILRRLCIYCFITFVTLLFHVTLSSLPKIPYPNFLLILVFFFELSEQKRLSKLFLIGLGIFNDYLDATLIGITSLQLIIVTLLLERNHKALEEQKFAIAWAAFAVLVFILYAIKICILSVYFQTALFSLGTVVTLLITITSYPLFHLALSKIFHYRLMDNAR